MLPSGVSLSCREDNSSPVESVKVSYSPFESTALLWIAQDRQFFIRNGLNITLRKYDTGAASLDGVLKGEAEIAVGPSEFQVVRKAFQKEKISILVNADKGEFIYFIGRKDRGIEKASDLKGKKVGVAVGTIAEFFLGRFLELNGMKRSDVTMVDLKTPAEWVNSVVNGEVDAVVTAQPDANAIKERLGANAFFWSAQGGQYLQSLVISTSEWTASHPETVKKFLKSLLQAEGYLAQNTSDAKTIIQKDLNLEAGYLETVWSQNQFALSLDQSLILAMEDEARWLIRNDLTIEKTVPNFLDYLYTESLKSIKPGSVHIPGK
jgi:ABC-type nitrate/sulfonate/bicarbonate transport system substrate-binding protein